MVGDELLLGLAGREPSGSDPGAGSGGGFASQGGGNDGGEAVREPNSHARLRFAGTRCRVENAGLRRPHCHDTPLPRTSERHWETLGFAHRPSTRASSTSVTDCRRILVQRQPEPPDPPELR